MDQAAEPAAPVRAAAARRPRVMIIYKSLPEYRRRFYESLRARLAEMGVELQLVYGQAGVEDAKKNDCVDLPWATRVKNRIWRVGQRDVYWQPCLRLTRQADLVIVEQANRLLLNYVLLVLRQLGLRRVAFWGHGRDFQAHGHFRMREWIKHRLTRHVDWWFAYNDTSVRVVQAAGYPAQRITNVQNAIDTRRLTEALQRTTPEQIQEMRARLGIRGQNVCIYTGGMYKDKRLEFLVHACDLLRVRVPDFEMIFVGSGPEAGVVREAAKTRPWMHFVGPQFDTAKVVYFAASKLLLMPGLVGLVALDAFALETPLVTTNVAYHSPEIEYVRDGANGVIVDPPEELEKYVSAVAGLLRDEPHRQKLIAGCRAARERYTNEAMVERFAGGIGSALREAGVMR